MSIMAYLGRASHIAVVRFAEPPGRSGELPRRVVFRVAVKPLLKKYSDLQNTQITFIPMPSCPPEGRLEIVTDAGQDAMDASGAMDGGALFRLR